MSVPKVLPIKQTIEPNGKMFHENLPDIGLGVPGKGALLVLLSPRNTGKSCLAVNLFLNPSMWGDPTSENGSSFEQVYVISPTINVDKSSRALKKKFITFDQYHPDIIRGIIDNQLSMGDDAPEIAIFIDDSVGLMDKELSMLSTKSRHMNCKLLIISSQKFKGALAPILRANITDLIVGSPFPNSKDLEAVADEFGDQYQGKDEWLKLYREATPNKYDFAYMRFGTPSEFYHNFEKKIY
tara:strand:+ start:1239 stop:1958 length:720 start_codon:yes stop_codon:yes gene_type:complete